MAGTARTGSTPRSSHPRESGNPSLLSTSAICSNVLIAALGSPNGASFQILTRIGTGAFDLALSVPLVLEYEHVAKREAGRLGFTPDDVDGVIDFLCRVGQPHPIYLHWRPTLPDLKDDMLLELAVQAGARYVVTHNLRDFVGCGAFGVTAIRPGEFLGKLRESPHEHDQSPSP